MGMNPFMSSIISGDGSTIINAQVLPDIDKYFDDARYALINDNFYILGGYNEMDLFDLENVIHLKLISI